MAKDLIHDAVKTALTNDGWTVTNEQYSNRIAHYRTLLKAILTVQAQEMEQQPVTGVDTELIIDEAHDNYMLAPVGWSPQGRVRGATLYVRIRNGKFYIEEDWTEEGITSHLLAAGVPKTDIVLAFHAPEMRPYTEFAVA